MFIFTDVYTYTYISIYLYASILLYLSIDPIVSKCIEVFSSTVIFTRYVWW